MTNWPASPTDETMSTSLESSLPSLLALVQAAALIQHTAQTGATDPQAISHLLDCLLCDKQEALEARISQLEQYAMGRCLLMDFLAGELAPKQMDWLRYLKAMVKLERTLDKRPALRSQLNQGLQKIRQRRRLFRDQGGEIFAALDYLYLETLAGLKQPLTVKGPQQLLLSGANGRKIKSAILGGVQAAGLWRQHKGRLWQLRWQRKKILNLLKKTGPAD